MTKISAADEVLRRHRHCREAQCEIGRILFLPEVEKRMEDIAVETAKSSPKELATLTRADTDKWGKIIKQLGITPQ
jgi:tripartite-type tricarboxylate transporter receptor subunit TctC